MLSFERPKQTKTKAPELEQAKVKKIKKKKEGDLQLKSPFLVLAFNAFSIQTSIIMLAIICRHAF